MSSSRIRSIVILVLVLLVYAAVYMFGTFKGEGSNLETKRGVVIYRVETREGGVVEVEVENNNTYITRDGVRTMIGVHKEQKPIARLGRPANVESVSKLDGFWDEVKGVYVTNYNQSWGYVKYLEQQGFVLESIEYTERSVDIVLKKEEKQRRVLIFQGGMLNVEYTGDSWDIASKLNLWLNEKGRI